MKKAILIIGLSLVSLASINAQNQPPQTVNACEWNKWVTVYGCDGVGHSRVKHLNSKGIKSK